MSVYEAAIRQNARRRQNLRGGAKRNARIALPPPLRGLNTNTPINQLRADEAYELVNLVPDGYALHTREGSTLAVNTGSPVRRTMTYSYLGQDYTVLVRDYTSNNYLMAPYPLLTSSFSGSNSRADNVFQGADFSYTMFNGYMPMVNGVDAPALFYTYGSTFYYLEYMQLTGMAHPETLAGVKAFKNRLYFWGREFGFWYLATNAIAGALTFFPLYSVAQSGGSIVSMNSWTRDGGSGPDDFLVITTSKGEVIVYQGSDPNDPNDWALVGRYQIGRPLSSRAFLELDGKLLALTETDLEVLPDKFQRQQPLSRIAKALHDNIADFGQLGGYRLTYDSQHDRVLVTIPTGTNSTDELVRTSFGYTRFTGIDSVDYATANGQLYVASSDYLLKVAGGIDRKNTGIPADITFAAKTGYQMFNQGSEARISAYRLKMRCEGSVTINTGLSFDQSGIYEPIQTQTETSYGTPWGSPWGSAWGINDGGRNDWLAGCGSGQSVSLGVSGSSKTGVEWSGTDIEVMPGGLY